GVGLGKRVPPTLDPTPPIAKRLVQLDIERGSHLGGWRFVCVPYPLSNEAWRIGQLMIGAPTFEGERRAVMGEQIGVEALDQRQRFEPADEAVRPGGRPGGRREEGRDQQDERGRQTS